MLHENKDGNRILYRSNSSVLVLQLPRMPPLLDLMTFIIIIISITIIIIIIITGIPKQGVGQVIRSDQSVTVSSCSLVTK